MYLRVHFYAAMYLLYQSRDGLATEALVGRVTYAGALGEFTQFVAWGRFCMWGRTRRLGWGAIRFCTEWTFQKKGGQSRNARIHRAPAC